MYMYIHVNVVAYVMYTHDLLHISYNMYTVACTQLHAHSWRVQLPNADGGRSRNELYSNGSWSRTFPDSKSGTYAGGGDSGEGWGGEGCDLVTGEG